jgi:hypothetical protein
MKRNMELIRKIMLAVEGHEHGFAPRELEIEGHSEEEVNYHNYLIVDAGLAEGVDVTTRGSESPEYIIRHLTSRGHDFCDAAGEPSRWQKAMTKIAAVGGSVTLKTLQALLIAYSKEQLGLASGD